MVEFWKNRRVFVTGATGLVGSWLVKELVAKNAQVVALIRDTDPRSEFFRSGVVNEVSVVSGSLQDYDSVERAINEYRSEIIFHLGAQAVVATAHRSPLQTFESNVRGTYNLLEACRRFSDSVSRVVIASSDKAYGEAERLPYTEDMPLQGRNPYEVSKSCADLIAQSYHHAYGVPTAISRCANIYGGGDLNWNRVVPGAIAAFLSQRRFVIRSDGTYVRDYLFVKDAVNAYLTLGEADDRVLGQAFNFSTESPVSVLELVNMIRGRMGHETLEPEIQGIASGEIHSQYLSAYKARSILGWSAEHTLESGIDQTIDWYRSYLKVPG